MARNKGTVYLIHFHRPYRHARHYLGWSKDHEGPVQAHREGRGARLMEVIVGAGISFDVVRTWKGGRSLERQLKKRKASPRLCPVCKAAAVPVCRKAA